MAKIILSVHFLGSPVWWPYIHFVINMDYINGCITKTALTYLCNLAGTDCELPEDDTIVSKHVGAV
jgi:hypothetical protein